MLGLKVGGNSIAGVRPAPLPALRRGAAGGPQALEAPGSIKPATRLHGTAAVYVLDEPTTGLHMSDVGGVLALLDRLVDAGNTVVVVGHDLDVVAYADWVVDLGPDGGRDGGEVIFEGAPQELLAAPGSVTAAYLRRATA